MTALARFFDSYYRLRPVNATFTGVHAYDDRLPDWSPDGLAAALDEMRGLRASLSAEQPDLTAVADRDRELAASFLDVQIAEHESRHFQRGNPSLAIGEAAFGVISLMTRSFAAVDARARSASARLEQVPAFLEGARRSLSGAIVDVWRVKALQECDGFTRLLTSGIEQWVTVESISASRAAALSAAASRAASAVADFRGWLERAASRPGDEAAIGPDFFDLLLARGHWTDRSRAELLATASAALDEAIARLHERSRDLAPGGWNEVQQRLAEAHPAVDDYLPAYQRIWDACRRHAVDRDLVSWPEAPIRYVPIPPQTVEAAPFLYYLFYRSPAPFDRLPVHDYVVTPIDDRLSEAERQRRLCAINTSVIKLNHVVHHGAIGHHVQNAFAYCGPSEIGRVAAVDCASRIGMFLGGTMAEGWACYATDLMDECGFLTPEESLAQQHTRARLLARAVADIGLHQRSMPFDDVVSIYRDAIGMSDAAARAETCKNAMFPGTALMYWLGTDAIHRLRRERERVEGPSFSLRRFHDRLLSYGSIPVPLIARIFA